MSSPSDSPPYHTERSGSKHDVQFYMRKVQRYECELAQAEQELAQAQFRLSKLDDLQMRHDTLFDEHQDVLAQLDDARAECERTRRQEAILAADADQLRGQLKLLTLAQQTTNQTLEQANEQKDALKTNSHATFSEEKDHLKAAFAKDISNLKDSHNHLLERANREISQLKVIVSNLQVVQSALQQQIHSLKQEKQTEVARLNATIMGLNGQLSSERILHIELQTKRTKSLFAECSQEKESNWRISQEIENTLLEQLRNLYSSLECKNNEISFLLDMDKTLLQENEEEGTARNQQIRRLEEKIFLIQRENELEIGRTIARLQKSYDHNLATLQLTFEDVRQTHKLESAALRAQIDSLHAEVVALGKEHVALEQHHKQLAQEKQHAIRSLSQNLIQATSAKDLDLKNYTTSMKQIETEAKAKLDDLHITILNKEGEVDILSAQLALKNTQIDHLLEQLSSLRALNREKLLSFSNTFSKEQENLNNEMNGLKRSLRESKNTIHSLEQKLTDQQAQHSLECNKNSRELLASKEQNEVLRGRNELLTEWCKELERELKGERVKNVGILHDHTSAKMDNVQVREQVRVEVEAIRDKEMEQIRNIHRLEKGRLEAELTKAEHELRDKKDQLSRLMVQFKNLESKVGKSSKVDKSAEEEGKCKATLNSEIYLTENIFNAINKM